MNESWATVLILGIVQGITEFLPISSSGHLAVLQRLFGITEDNLLISVTLHAGTLCSITLYYWKDLLKILTEKKWWLVILLLVATLPLAFPGLLLKDMIEEASTDLWVAAGGFLITAILLLMWHRGDGNRKIPGEMTLLDAIGIGLMQCLALLPGVSRSGATISTAGGLGLRTQDAARFSFFLGLPAILGATVLQARDLFAPGSTADAPQIGYAPLAVGFLVSFAVGYAALALLIRLLGKGKFRRFAYYCFGAAIVTIAIQVITGGK